MEKQEKQYGLNSSSNVSPADFSVLLQVPRNEIGRTSRQEVICVNGESREYRPNGFEKVQISSFLWKGACLHVGMGKFVARDVHLPLVHPTR